MVTFGPIRIKYNIYQGRRSPAAPRLVRRERNLPLPRAVLRRSTFPGHRCSWGGLDADCFRRVDLCAMDQAPEDD